MREGAASRRFQQGIYHLLYISVNEFLGLAAHRRGTLNETDEGTLSAALVKTRGELRGSA